MEMKKWKIISKKKTATECECDDKKWMRIEPRKPDYHWHAHTQNQQVKKRRQ